MNTPNQNGDFTGIPEKLDSSAEAPLLSKRVPLVRVATTRQFIVLSGLSAILISALCVYYWFQYTSYDLPSLPLLPLVLLSGIFGGFMGIQKRLPDMKYSDLELFVSSWLATCLPSIYGSLLALILFILFLTGILGGSLFPSFILIASKTSTGFESILNIQAKEYQDVAKLIFWSFVSGYSERFVLGTVEMVERRASEHSERQPDK